LLQGHIDLAQRKTEIWDQAPLNHWLMRVLGKPSHILCLSASSLALGAFLSTVEVPVWVGKE